jgi:hypothetical protein
MKIHITFKWLGAVLLLASLAFPMKIHVPFTAFGGNRYQVNAFTPGSDDWWWGSTFPGILESNELALGGYLAFVALGLYVMGAALDWVGRRSQRSGFGVEAAEPRIPH